MRPSAPYVVAWYSRASHPSIDHSMAYSPLLLNIIVPRASGTNCMVLMESGESKEMVRIWAHVHHARPATRALFLNFLRD